MIISCISCLAMMGRLKARPLFSACGFISKSFRLVCVFILQLSRRIKTVPDSVPDSEERAWQRGWTRFGNVRDFTTVIWYVLTAWTSALCNRCFWIEPVALHTTASSSEMHILFHSWGRIFTTKWLHWVSSDWLLISALRFLAWEGEVLGLIYGWKRGSKRTKRILMAPDWHLPSRNVRSSPFSFSFYTFLPSSPLRSPSYFIKTTAALPCGYLIPFPQITPHAAFKHNSKATTFLYPKYPSAPNTLSIGVKGSSCATSGVLCYPHRKGCWQSTRRDKSKTTKQLAS